MRKHPAPTGWVLARRTRLELAASGVTGQWRCTFSKRFLQIGPYQIASYSPCFALGATDSTQGAGHLRDEVGYFQAIQSNLKKYTTGGSGCFIIWRTH